MNPLAIKLRLYSLSKIAHDFLILPNGFLFVKCNSQFQAPTPPPPRATPGILHPTAAPGPEFILDDLPRGRVFAYP